MEVKSTSPTRHLSAAPLDSRRFGITVLRGTIDAAADTAEVIEEIEASDADLVIFRVPAGCTAVPTGLQRRGSVVIHADTLVYYGMDLDRSAAPPAEAKVQRATDAHRAALAVIADRSFCNYRAHYAANPLLSRDLVLSGYVEWALSRLSQDRANEATWVVIEEGTVAGFATCDISGDSVEIILNAVHPDFERRGLYGMLLRHIQHHYAHQSLKKLLISTQIWNFTVQRQWGRNGLQLQRAFDTYHMDRRLTPSSGGR
ncbi:GNAT family N-acetyltransferase [Stenotrophomonas sp. NPDC077659]|uniref:GNAT family N-acetyltransferase n=1 Tax=Stenotrophomonas sp. NPDC077659 TaxID=3390694 RepID=UPI003D0031EA